MELTLDKLQQTMERAFSMCPQPLCIIVGDEVAQVLMIAILKRELEISIIPTGIAVNGIAIKYGKGVDGFLVIPPPNIPDLIPIRFDSATEMGGDQRRGKSNE
jgi:hypothetical protein